MAVHGKKAFGPFIGHGLEIPIDSTVICDSNIFGPYPNCVKKNVWFKAAVYVLTF